MPINRVSLRNFDKRLALNAPADQIPQEALRRARGLRSIPTGSLLSRWGSTKLYDLANVNSLFRFDGDRFAGTTAGAFYRNGSSIKTGLSGARLTAISMSPSPDVADQLMVAGGGDLFKVSGAGTVTDWGMATDIAIHANNWTLASELADTTGWADTDYTTGQSTQTTFDSKSCFRFTFTADGVGGAFRKYALTDPANIVTPKTVWVMFKLQADVLRTLVTSTGDAVRVIVYLAGTAFQVDLVLTGSSPASTGTYNPIIPALDTWYEYWLKVDTVAETMDVYRDGVLIAAAQDVVVNTNLTGSSYVEIGAYQSASTAPYANVYFDFIYVLTDQMRAAAGTQATKVIEDFEAYGDWTNSGFKTIANEATFKRAGTNSLKLELSAGRTGKITQSVTLDLTTYTTGSTDISPKEDIISFWMACDNVSALNYLQVEFSLNDTNFNDTFVRKTEQHYDPGRKKRKGAADVSTVSEGDLIDAPTGAELYTTVSETLADATNPATDATWKHVCLPKSAFQQVGSTAYDWSDVKALRISAKATKESAIFIYLDDMQLLGGAGLQGDYQYAVTFLNSSTGARSNQVGNTVTVSDVTRTPVELSYIPQPIDTQVDYVEIWRTLGNGAVFFYVDRVAVGTTTYTDTVADIYALDSRPGAVYISQTELPNDNDIPESTFSWVAGPYNASAFWLNSATGTKGRVYYSPIGRPEAVEGYISVTSDEDPLQCLVIFSGALFAFSYAKVYQIAGTNPYTAREVFMVPGTRAPHTVQPTPYGIVYQADDGVRLFNGSSSELGASQVLHRIFNGEALENLSAFEGVVATYARGEYVVASTANTLAVSGETGAWRDVGLALGALCFEPDTGKLVGATSTKILTLEDENTYADDTSTITFAVDTAGIRAPDDGVWLVDTLSLDCNTGANDIVTSALVNGTQVALGTTNTSARSGASYSVGYLAHYVQARLTGSLITNPCEIYGISFDVVPLELVIRVEGQGEVTIPARMAYDRTYVEFRIDDWAQLHPTKRYLDWKMLWAEADCNGNSLTPTLYFADETLALAANSTVTRDYITWPINRLSRLKAVRLAGTFSAAIELRRVEMDVRVPKGTS